MGVFNNYVFHHMIWVISYDLYHIRFNYESICKWYNLYHLFWKYHTAIRTGTPPDLYMGGGPDFDPACHGISCLKKAIWYGQYRSMVNEPNNSILVSKVDRVRWNCKKHYLFLVVKNHTFLPFQGHPSKCRKIKNVTNFDTFCLFDINIDFVFFLFHF